MASAMTLEVRPQIPRELWVVLGRGGVPRQVFVSRDEALWYAKGMHACRSMEQAKAHVYEYRLVPPV
jgi:hypothetical protein